jgi:protein-disulfide isomerase
MDRKTLTTSLSILIAGALIAVAIFFSSRASTPAPLDGGNPPSQVTGEGLDIGSAPVLGDADAPITIVEFGDYQCPFCALFYNDIEPQLRDTYVENGTVKVVFKALAFLDDRTGPRESYLSALAGECAKEQGSFWAMHDRIYGTEYAELESGGNSENNGNLDMDFFRAQAVELGIDVDQFVSCMETDTYADQLALYAQEAQAAMPGGVSTPAVFINGVRVENPFNFEEISSKINMNQ